MPHDTGEPKAPILEPEKSDSGGGKHEAKLGDSAGAALVRRFFTGYHGDGTKKNKASISSPFLKVQNIGTEDNPRFARRLGKRTIVAAVAALIGLGVPVSSPWSPNGWMPGEGGESASLPAATAPSSPGVKPSTPSVQPPNTPTPSGDITSATPSSSADPAKTTTSSAEPSPGEGAHPPLDVIDFNPDTATERDVYKTINNIVDIVRQRVAGADKKGATEKDKQSAQSLGIDPESILHQSVDVDGRTADGVVVKTRSSVSFYHNTNTDQWFMSIDVVSDGNGDGELSRVGDPSLMVAYELEQQGDDRFQTVTINQASISDGLGESVSLYDPQTGEYNSSKVPAELAAALAKIGLYVA